MPFDSKRIFGPESVPPSLYDAKKPEPENPIKEDGTRLDGRSPDEMRPSHMKTGLSSDATGSAYYECGDTKILCSVYGPRDVLRKSEFTHKGQLFCEYKCAPYACQVRQPYVPTNEEKSISVQIQQALESVVLLHKFPKTRIEIFIHVLEDGGGAIGHALTCAGAALSNAGVEMYDLVVGCTLVQSGNNTLIDPTLYEENFTNVKSESHGKVIMGLMPYYNQVVFLQQDGTLRIDVLSQCLKDLMASCRKLVTMITECLYKETESKLKQLVIQEDGDGATAS